MPRIFNQIIMLKRFTKHVVGLLLLVCSISLVSAAGGVGGYPLNPLDSENPGWFIYDLDLGESYSDVVMVKNDSAQEWIIDIYPADSTPSYGGGFAVSQRVEEMVELGSWVELARDEVRLGPGETARVPFTITIPQNASVGETAGAIMFERRDPYASDEAVTEGGIKLNIRTGVRIYNTVPGDIKQELVMRDFAISHNERQDGTGYYLVRSSVENVGNISSTVQYEITVSTGVTGEELDKNEAEFLVMRGTTFENNYELEALPGVGKVNVKLDAYLKKKDGSTELIASREDSIIVIPWFEIVFILTAFGLTVTYVIYYRRKYSGKGWVQYAVKKDDNIIEIAAKHNVDWKVLAKTNKLDSPYLLDKGVHILVPPTASKKK
jgi:hypothetical protein